MNNSVFDTHLTAAKLWERTMSALPNFSAKFKLPKVKLWSIDLKPESKRSRGHIRFLMLRHRYRNPRLCGFDLNFLCLIKTPGLVDRKSKRDRLCRRKYVYPIFEGDRGSLWGDSRSTVCHTEVVSFESNLI